VFGVPLFENVEICSAPRPVMDRLFADALLPPLLASSGRGDKPLRRK